MSDFYFIGAKKAPIDIHVTVDGGAGVIWLDGIDDVGANLRVIDPAASAPSNMASARARIVGPSDTLRYVLKFYCILDTDAPGATVHLKLTQGQTVLKCFSYAGEDQTSGAHGVNVGTVAHRTMFIADFRVLP